MKALGNPEISAHCWTQGGPGHAAGRPELTRDRPDRLLGDLPAVVVDAVVVGDVEVVVQQRREDGTPASDPRVLEQVQVEQVVMGVDDVDRPEAPLALDGAQRSGHCLGRVSGRPSCFIPFSTWVDTGRSGVAVDQVTDEQVVLLQSPPEVTDGPEPTSRHAQWGRGGVGRTPLRRHRTIPYDPERPPRWLDGVVVPTAEAQRR